MFIQLSNVGELYRQLKTNQRARLALIRKYICHRREAPLQSFIAWLQQQDGFHNCTEAELQDFYNITFEISDDLRAPSSKLR